MLHINRYPVYPDGWHKKQSGFGPLSGTLDSQYIGTSVFNPTTLGADPDYGVPRFLWIKGDGQDPRIRPDPALVLAAGGVGAITNNGVSPFRYPDGSDVLMEQYDGASYRTCPGYTLSPVDPVNDDVVIAVKGVLTISTYHTLFGTYNSTLVGGWVIYYNPPGYRIVFNSAANATGVANPAFAIGSYSPFIFIVVMDRVARTLSAGMNNYFGSGEVDNAASIVGHGTSLAANTNGTSPMAAASRLEWAAMWSGAGIAANWTASSGRLLHRLSCESMGMRETQTRRVFDFAVRTPASENGGRFFKDHNGRWWLSAEGSPIAGNPLGMTVEGNHTNYCLRNFNPSSTASYTATGGTFAVVTDTAALAAAKAEPLGPYVYRLINATGVTRYVYGTYSATAAPHSLQVMARYTAGANAQLGWWDVSAGTFTALATILDNYEVTYYNDSTPGDVDWRWCIAIPDGCTLLFTGQQLELGRVATSACATTTAARRFTGDLGVTENVPADISGSYLTTVAPARWGGIAPGAQALVLGQDAGGGAAPALLCVENAIAGWSTGDTTTLIQTVAPYVPADGTYVQVWTAWRSPPAVPAGLQYIQQGVVTVASLVTGAYDLTKTPYVTPLRVEATLPFKVQQIEIRTV